jgi:hypothetical protein
MRRPICAALVLLLHALTVLALLPTSSAAPPPQHTKPPPQAPERLTGADRDVTVRVKLPGPGNAGGISCTGGSYIGVGVMVSARDEVMMVGERTPAERAGLMRGDKVMNGEVWTRDSNVAGTVLHLVIMRDGKQFERDVTVGRICTD